MKKGIDISQHQGEIDFKKVKEDGIEFIILRLGWIGNKENHTLDSKFEEYYKQCKKYKIKIGAYVYSYCNNVDTVTSGAKWTLEKLNGKTLDYPVFIDLEDSTIKDLSKDNLTSQAIAFCELVKQKYKSGIYANLEWFKNKLNTSGLMDYKIWLAQWTSANTHSATHKVDMWQYSNKGKVNGIQGNVDLNYCMCNCDNNTTNKKSNEEIADEVIKGYWGNGADRINNLKKAGYNYSEIQTIVNNKLLNEAKNITKGSRVKVIGKYDVNGTKLASFVNNEIYDVLQVKNNEVVIGKGNKVTARVKLTDCIKV